MMVVKIITVIKFADLITQRFLILDMISSHIIKDISFIVVALFISFLYPLPAMH